MSNAEFVKAAKAALRENVEIVASPARMKERIAELEAALRPFAALADEIERTASEAACNHGAVVGPARWVDCKAARDALRKEEPMMRVTRPPGTLDDLRDAGKMLSDIAERMRADRIPMPLGHYATTLEYYAKCVAEAVQRHATERRLEN